MIMLTMIMLTVLVMMTKDSRLWKRSGGQWWCENRGGDSSMIRDNRRMCLFSWNPLMFDVKAAWKVPREDWSRYLTTHQPSLQFIIMTTTIIIIPRFPDKTSPWSAAKLGKHSDLPSLLRRLLSSLGGCCVVGFDDNLMIIRIDNLIAIIIINLMIIFHRSTGTCWFGSGW